MFLVWLECCLKYKMNTDLLLEEKKCSINFTGKNVWCPEQKVDILMEGEDQHRDPLCVERTDLSENSSGGKHFWTNTEER